MSGAPNVTEADGVLLDETASLHSYNNPEGSDDTNGGRVQRIWTYRT